MTKLLKTVFLSILAVGLLSIGVYLFFGNKIIFYLENTNWYMHRAAMQDKELLRIGYSMKPESFDPTVFNASSRQYMVDIYEGLVKTDQDLNIKTGLAISWGMARENIWEFRLRPDVMFHNGQTMTAEDVVYSINLAKDSSRSELSNLLGTVSSVKALSSDKVQIETYEPDPLLLNKLSLVYIVPEDHTDYENAVGTGPYQLIGKKSGLISLQRFDQYWGDRPIFINVDLHVIPDRKNRIEALESGSIDILGNVPPNVACSLTEKYSGYDGCSEIASNDVVVETIPSLEVSFLMLNFNNYLLKDKEIRNSLKHLFDYNVFNDLAFGFTVKANQFVSNGVFGYSPDIAESDYDIESVKELIGKKLGGSFERPLLVFDYPVGLEPIGIYVRDQFREIGIDVKLNPLQPAELESKIKKGISDIYFFGWKSELGDSADFMFSVAHSRDDAGLGQFNGINFSSRKVDDLLQKSKGLMDPAKRIKPLQDAMEIIVSDDVIGIPLYESEIIYAFNKQIKFQPRIDGYIMASEIK